jgi:acetyl esterase/lipase
VQRLVDRRFAPRRSTRTCGPDVPATAAPAPVKDGLPPAYDRSRPDRRFRDEDLAYATKLSRAGVPVEFHLHQGAPHEFDFIAFDSDVAPARRRRCVRVLISI